MKNRMFGGLGMMALAFTLAVVGVDAFAHQARAAETNVNPMLQDCAKACSDCQRACDHCATHCATLVAEGKKEHLTTLKECQDCATCCSACASVCARGGPQAALMADCCAKCCDQCAKVCEKFPDDKHMKACAEECQKCQKRWRSTSASNLSHAASLDGQRWPLSDVGHGPSHPCATDCSIPFFQSIPSTAKPFRSAWQTVIVGGLAATAAFVIAKAIG